MNAFSRCILTLALSAIFSVAAYAQTTAPPTASTMARPQETAPSRADEADELVERLRTYSVIRRQEAIAQAREPLDQLDRRIAQLQTDVQTRWTALGQDARSRVNADMADLRARRTQLAEWYGGMRHASDQAWGEVRSGFIASYHELSDAFRRARAEFDQTQRQPEGKQAQDEQRPREPK